MDVTSTSTAAPTVGPVLTDRAAEEVRKFIASEQVPVESAGLRVSVMPGGCSGFKYSLNIEERALDDDVVLDCNGVRVFVDGFSVQYLNGVLRGRAGVQVDERLSVAHRAREDREILADRLRVEACHDAVPPATGAAVNRS